MRATLIAFFYGGAALFGQDLTGLWDATVVSGGVTVPFRMEFEVDGDHAVARFINGQERLPSTSGTFDQNHVSIQFEQLGTHLEADYKYGSMQGTYYGSRRTGTLPFTARRAEPKLSPRDQPVAPDISGEWNLEVKSGKGEHAWRFLVQQKNAEVMAAILRIDGDTGALTGKYRDGKFVLSHFSGARAAVLEIVPNADGSLALTMNGSTHYAAVRPALAKAAPDNPEEHTRVKDPTEKFHFSFEDLNGMTVSDDDADFEGKVVIVSLLGSWCPNCHDEAPFLAELYRQYRNRGLEIVGLAFEEEDQLKDPARLRAYVKSYGIQYPVLVCGTPEQAAEKLPQLENFNAWPTILFLGRDGKFRGAHAGFPSDGSGDVLYQTKQEIETTVRKLLAENTAR